MRKALHSAFPADARWQILLFTAVTALSLAIPLILLNQDNKILQAQVAVTRNYYDDNRVMAVVRVMNTDEASLNRFVSREFGYPVDCYLSEKLVVCSDGNRTLSYKSDEPTGDRTLLTAPKNVCKKYALAGEERRCDYSGPEVKCYMDAYLASTLAMKFDAGNSNGVNYLQTLTNVIKFIRKDKTAGCSSATIKYGDGAGRIDRPNSVKWYVGSGTECEVEDTYLVEFGYTPGITISSNNLYVSTPKMTKFEIRGYDIKQAFDTIKRVALSCTGEQLTSCTLKLPFTAKFSVSVSMEKLFKIKGYEMIIQLGANLRRWLRMARREATCNFTCDTSICTLGSPCSLAAFDTCKTTTINT